MASMLRLRFVDRTTATADPLGVVVISGDYGGFKYVICRASRVRASDEVLNQLALDLDARINNRGPADEVELKVLWAISNRPEEWGGSPEYEDGLWIWPQLLSRDVSPKGIKDVLCGSVVERVLDPPAD